MQNNILESMRNLAMNIDLEYHQHGERIDSMMQEFLSLAKELDDTTNNIDTNTDDAEWTSERFVNEVLNDEIKYIYEENHDQYVQDIYRLGADIMNITSGMNVSCQPYVKHIFWLAGNKRLFGINLFSRRPAPTIVDVTEDGHITVEEIKEITSSADFAFYPQYSQVVLRSNPPTDKLKRLFEEIYLRRSSLVDSRRSSSVESN